MQRVAGGESVGIAADVRIRRSTVQRLLDDPLLAVVRILVAAAVVLLAVPVITLVGSSLGGAESAPTLENFVAILTHPLFAPTLRNTLTLGIGTVIVMLLCAVPMAWLFTRTDLPRKDLLLALITVNIAIPSFLVAMGYIFLFNPSNGLANQVARLLFSLTASPFNIYDIGWMIALQGIALSAPAFFMIVPTFQGIDAALEEAASVSGVRRGVTAVRIVLPLAAPALLAASAYYFIIAIETFDYASMLGMPVRLFVASTWLYQLVNPGSGLPQYGEAAALGVMTAAASLLFSALYLWSIRKAARYAVVTGKRRAQRAVPLGRFERRLAWSFIALYSVFAMALPLLMLVWASGLAFMQPPSLQAFARWNLDAYREAWAQLPLLVTNNLVIMLTVPTISVALAACTAWISTRSRANLRRSLDLFVMMAIAVPSIVSALGFLYFGLAIYRVLPIYSTIWLIVIAMSTRYLTWSNRTISSAMLQVHPEIEEACATSGVRRGHTFMSVTLPTVGSALLFSWFWLALLSLRELTIPVMLARPNTAVLATAIWGLNSAGNADVAAALSVILVGIILVMVFVFHRVAGRWAL